MVLSFEQSGPGAPADFGLADVKELALAHGFSKPNDLFNVYGVNALSHFKKKWSSEKLAPPGSVGAPAPSTPTKKKSQVSLLRCSCVRVTSNCRRVCACF